MNKPSVSAGVVAGVALGAAALGAAAVAVRAACLQVARTRNGLARVKRVHDERGDEVRVLVQGGVYQSASYVGDRWAEPVFAYYRAFDDVFESEDAMRDAYGYGIDRMLMLGGGGFAYPKFALMSHESLRMDVIEYDAEITRLARRWFYLDELERTVGDRLRVITAEARSYLGVTSVGHRRYDVVVSDCFGGAEPVRELATVEALRLVRGSLNSGGIYVANIVSSNEGNDVTFLRDCAATALEVFVHAARAMAQVAVDQRELVVGHALHQKAVVRHQNQRAGPAVQQVLDNRQHVGIQVVARLVHDEHVRFVEQNEQ